MLCPWLLAVKLFNSPSDALPLKICLPNLLSQFVSHFDPLAQLLTPHINWIWLKIYTIGVQSNRNGIGARIEITTSGLGTQIRDVRSGEGFRYMGSLNTHFGIGSDTSITSVNRFDTHF